MTNERNCLLAGMCKLAATPACSRQCEDFIRLHGHSGSGGRAGAAGLPADYRLVTLANSPARDDQAQIYEFLTAKYIPTFERQFEEGERVKSLYLYSEAPGTGKTTTASAILNAWIMANYVGAIKRGLQPDQQPAYFLDVNEWQTLFNEFNRKNIPADVGEKASREYYRREARARTAPFAVFDDIGVRTATEAFRGDLHALINHRVTNGLPTVYTSNLPLAQMETVFDARLYDRVRDQCAVMSFIGTSKRGRR